MYLPDKCQRYKRCTQALQEDGLASRYKREDSHMLLPYNSDDYFQNFYSDTQARRSTKGPTVITTAAYLYLNRGFAHM
jgi:hypothetical protein